jgi:hypothetical protein
MHFSDAGAGMREYDPPLKDGDEIQDGRGRHESVRIEKRQTRAGLDTRGRRSCRVPSDVTVASPDR